MRPVRRAVALKCRFHSFVLALVFFGVGATQSADELLACQRQVLTKMANVRATFRLERRRSDAFYSRLSLAPDQERPGLEKFEGLWIRKGESQLTRTVQRLRVNGAKAARTEFHKIEGAKMSWASTYSYRGKITGSQLVENSPGYVGEDFLRTTFKINEYWPSDLVRQDGFNAESFESNGDVILRISGTDRYGIQFNSRVNQSKLGVVELTEKLMLNGTMIEDRSVGPLVKRGNLWLPTRMIRELSQVKDGRKVLLESNTYWFENWSFGKVTDSTLR